MVDSRIYSYIGTIRALAREGSASYNQYFIEPLKTWHPQGPPLKPHIFNRDVDSKAVEKRPPLFHRAIAGSIHFKDYSSAGTITIRFLREMLIYSVFSESKEAEELIALLREPFGRFNDREYLKMGESFLEKMSSLDREVFQILLTGSKGGKLEESGRADEIAARERILLRNMSAGVNRQSRIVSYLIRYAIPSMVVKGNHVQYLFDDLGIDDENSQKELLDTAAVVLYHDMLSAIKDNKLKKAVKNISRYAILFRGNPDTPFHHQMDSFEKKFMEMVEERDMWDGLS